VWDTAGQERFRAITHAYYKGATGALLVFDITRRSSYDNLPKWLKELKENSEENIVCILVGNKSDLSEQRAIRQEEVAEFAQ
jgi:Ras-related protein Rab-11A